MTKVRAMAVMMTMSLRARAQEVRQIWQTCEDDDEIKVTKEGQRKE